MKLWTKLVNWFENGNLMPMIILVSIPHYARVLSGYDWYPVASVVGFLIDLGHYRTIKSYLRGKGWFWMAVLTAFSYGFHLTFYWLGGAGWGALFIGGAVPVVIFALSWISRSDHLDTKAARAAESPTAKITAPETPLLEGRKVAGMLPEPSGQISDWRKLSPDDRAQVAGMSTADIVAKWNVSERTARNWRKAAQEAK